MFTSAASVNSPLRNPLSDIADRLDAHHVEDPGLQGIEDIDVVFGNPDLHHRAVRCMAEMEVEDRATAGPEFGELAGGGFASRRITRFSRLADVRVDWRVAAQKNSSNSARRSGCIAVGSVNKAGIRHGIRWTGSFEQVVPPFSANSV